jgi:hypothetical protein
MLFKEITAVYSQNHTKPINTKYRASECYSTLYIWLPFGSKRLMFKTDDHYSYTLGFLYDGRLHSCVILYETLLWDKT